jgi:PleD family two-component response regulator
LETFGRPGVGRSPEDDMGRMHAIVPAFDAAKMQLLVVDDSALNRKIIVQVMKSLGHKCIEADDGSVAVDIIRKALVDKVVIDAVLMDNVGPLLCVLINRLLEYMRLLCRRCR